MPGTWWTENDRENKNNYGTIIWIVKLLFD